MQELLPLAHQIAATLKERRQTIAVSESSTGGLISAALLAVPGASAYFLGGAVVYTRGARDALIGIPDAAVPRGMRSSSEPYALLCARTVRERLKTDWGIGETGASGPTGNRYGDKPGHTCLAVAGHVERVTTLETGRDDRVANMRAFAKAGLDLLAQCLAQAKS